MPLIEKLLPREANNDYRGSPVALYAFVVLALVMAGRSLIHFFKEDSGVNSIATIVTFPGDPDPNQVIYMFSALWGSQQTLLVLLYAVVLFRYRNLLPLMYVVMFLEFSFRLVVGAIHPLSTDHFLRTPPGAIINVPGLAITATLLLLSLTDRGAKRAIGSAAEGVP